MKHFRHELYQRLREKEKKEMEGKKPSGFSDDFKNRFYDNSSEQIKYPPEEMETGQPVPCKKCGNTSKPLHYNRLCPDCFELPMIKSPTERKMEHVEYVLKKYLDKKELYKIVFTMSDARFNKLMDDIKGGE